MGLSKKDQRTRDQKEKVANGTKVECTAAGVPKKPPKVMVSCSVCKGSFIGNQPITLRDHAGKHPKILPADCFPGSVVAP